LGLVVAGTVLTGTASLAAGSQVSGRISYTLAHLSDVKIVQKDKSFVLSRDTLSGTISASVAGSALDKSKQVCVGATLVDAAGKTIEGHGSCDSVDADGDVWWLVYSTKGPSKSRWIVVGGTGKYKRLRGTGTTRFLQQLQGVQATQQTWEQIYDGQMTGLPK
jgi:hypothetical protein